MTINPHPIALTREAEQRVADLHAAAGRERALEQARRGRERSTRVATVLVPVMVRRLTTKVAGVRGFVVANSPAIVDAPLCVAAWESSAAVCA